ncbi:MAG: class I SAM-dependent methyltransferase [Bacteroidales bacterium]|jgi:23S rRNA (cytosine1962-C5)-methyltransferase
MKQVILKHGRDKSAKRWHPWVFSGAIQKVTGTPISGETIELVSADGQFLGRGFWSPESQMSVRMWSFSDEEIGPEFFRIKIKEAVSLRLPPVMDSRSTGIRLVHSESDGLPGLTVDRYGDFLVCQVSTAGAEYWKNTLMEILRESTGCKGIFERSDLAVRKKEGLQESVGLLWGEEPPELIEFTEEDRKYQVNVRTGHKTGFYLDQRDNRSHVGLCSKDLDVLDCFSYTGGFAVAALTGGARHVTLLDSSGPALDQATLNINLNGIPEDRFTLMNADVFQALRKFRIENRKFDMIILDPPKFVESRNQIDKGARAYKDINMIAVQLLNPGGYLFTFSCSGHMEDLLFQKIVADAALDAKRKLKILRWLSQAPDHPVIASFPEGKYLKGLMAVAG